MPRPTIRQYTRIDGLVAKKYANKPPKERYPTERSQQGNYLHERLAARIREEELIRLKNPEITDRVLRSRSISAEKKFLDKHIPFFIKSLTTRDVDIKKYIETLQKKFAEEFIKENEQLFNIIPKEKLRYLIEDSKRQIENELWKRLHEFSKSIARRINNALSKNKLYMAPSVKVNEETMKKAKMTYEIFRQIGIEMPNWESVRKEVSGIHSNVFYRVLDLIKRKQIPALEGLLMSYGNFKNGFYSVPMVTGPVDYLGNPNAPGHHTLMLKKKLWADPHNLKEGETDRRTIHEMIHLLLEKTKFESDEFVTDYLAVLINNMESKNIEKPRYLHSKEEVMETKRRYSTNANNKYDYTRNRNPYDHGRSLAYYESLQNNSTEAVKQNIINFLRNSLQ
jgi:hypothetical protein